MTNAGLYIPKPLPTNFIALCLHEAKILDKNLDLKAALKIQVFS